MTHDCQVRDYTVGPPAFHNRGSKEANLTIEAETNSLLYYKTTVTYSWLYKIKKLKMRFTVSNNSASIWTKFCCVR